MLYPFIIKTLKSICTKFHETSKTINEEMLKKRLTEIYMGIQSFNVKTEYLENDKKLIKTLYILFLS